MPTYKEDLHMGNKLPVVLCGCCCGGNGGSGGGGGGGGSYEIPDGSITTNKLADGAVTTPKIANGAVTFEKLSEDVQSRFGSGGGTISVDKDFSDTSVFPVQNKVVTDGIKNGINQAYQPANYSGMGKVYIRKNLVDRGDAVVNVLTQDIFAKDSGSGSVPNTDTIYVIKYDFDLDGNNIVIPARCALKFEGGSLSNGVVFSNATVLMGNAKMEKYFGAFKDEQGRWLDQDLKPFDLVVKRDGYVGMRDFYPAQAELHYNGTQSVAVCSYGGNEYILTAKIDTEDTDGVESRAFIVVTDINYQPIGYTYLDYYGHGNGITVKDGYLYVPGGENHSYYKVSVGTIITNVINNNAPTESGQVVPADSLMQNMYFDNRTEHMLISKDEDRKYYVYDKNDNLVKALQKEPFEYFPEDGDAAGRQQCCMVNGIIYQLMIGMGPRENYLAIIDAQTEELIMWKIFRERVEIEGICFYNGAFYLAFQNTLFYKMGTHGNDFVATEDYLRNNNNAMTIYVDSSWTGVQKGNAKCPFSSLASALAITNGLPSLTVYLAKREKIYCLDEGLTSFSVDGTFMCYHERLSLNSYNGVRPAITDTDVKITGTFYFRGLVFRADNVTFDGINNSGQLLNLNEPPRSLNSVVFNGCTIKNYATVVFGNYNYNVEATGCTFDNLSRITNDAGYGRLYIEGSTIKDVTNINPGGRGARVELYNNRYDNSMIGTAYCIPKVICRSNEQVDNFIYDHLNNGLTIGGDGIDLDIQHTSGTASSEETSYGVTYVRGLFRTFVMGEVAEDNPMRIRGMYCRQFPVRGLTEFNLASEDFRSIFEGTFEQSYNYPNCGVRMYKADANTAPIAVLATKEGKTYYAPSGTVRPTMYFPEDVGNVFLDTTIGKLIYWTGDTSLGADGWVDGNGEDPDSSSA